MVVVVVVVMALVVVVAVVVLFLPRWPCETFAFFLRLCLNRG